MTYFINGARLAGKEPSVQPIPIIAICPVCEKPAHPGETNDHGQHPECEVEASLQSQHKELAALADGVRAYNGWSSHYEYPGQIEFRHHHGKVVVFATPDHERRGWLSVEVQDADGSSVEIPTAESHMGVSYDEGGEIPFTVRTSDALFAAVKPWLDLHQPKVHPALADILAVMDLALEGTGVLEGAGEYIEVLDALLAECHRRRERRIVERAKQREANRIAEIETSTANVQARLDRSGV